MKYVFVLNTVLYTCLLSVISEQLICPVYEKSLRFQAEKAYQLIGPKVFLLIKIRPEYSDILYNPTHFPGPLVCWIRQIPLYI